MEEGLLFWIIVALAMQAGGFCAGFVAGFDYRDKQDDEVTTC